MRIGIFGGTFDPPHVGHLILADEAFHQLNLDRLLWVLTPDPPHKQGQEITSCEMRQLWVEVAVLSEPFFQVSQVDIDRPGPHYALDTVNLLAQQYPGAELFYLVGEDSLRDLPTWYKPRELVAALAGLGVMRRPGGSADLSQLEAAIPGISAKVHWIEAPLLEISSREIRQRVAEGRAWRHYLPLGVARLIEDMDVYRD